MERIFPKNLEKRWLDHKGLIQVFVGPRQVGKTTRAISLSDSSNTVFYSADSPAPPTTEIIEEHWQKAREIKSENRTLILDEIQKVPGWSEVVKLLWDEDKRNKTNLRVAILGSSAVLIEKGLSESLTGRFETNFFPHWTYSEVFKLSSASIEQFSMLGGYPKAYDFINEPERAKDYISNSILEPTLGRDILSLHAVNKPALLRQLFWYVSRLPAQIVSFQKILDHLQDKGNSATLVHYAELLRLAFIVVPIFKFSQASHKTKRSIPKWLIPNPALVSEDVKNQTTGFVFENLIGSHLLNLIYGKRNLELKYWRQDNKEIDFVLTKSNIPVIAIEVKSGRKKPEINPKTLELAKIDSPKLTINQDNVLGFLQTTSIEEVLNISK